jgi:hypothetical protein
MGRSFSIEKRPLRAKQSFDADAWFVCIDPQHSKNADGSTSVSMGFPVCAVTGWVSDGDKIADLIARLLAEHYAKQGEVAA